MLARLAGNELTRQALTEALSAGRLGHSVLLCGEAGCGAGFAARCLAADYLYPAGGPAAEAVLRGESPECAALRGSGSGGIIKVEQIRAARAALYETSLSAAGRVQIVYGAHKMNPASANALLKILEEPPPGVLFILTAPGVGSVLPTIRSRCRLYTVAPLPQADCAALLRAEYPACDEPHAQDLARAFGGRAGAALALLQSPDGDALLREAWELAAAAARLLRVPEKELLALRILLEQYALLAKEKSPIHLRRNLFGIFFQYLLVLCLRTFEIRTLALVVGRHKGNAVLTVERLLCKFVAAKRTDVFIALQFDRRTASKTQF